MEHGEPGGLDLRTLRDGYGHWTITVRGEMDAFSAPEMEAAIAAAVASGARGVSLDLTGLEFIDGASMGILLSSADRAAMAGCALEVARSSRAVHRVADLLGVERTLFGGPESAGSTRDMPAARVGPGGVDGRGPAEGYRRIDDRFVAWSRDMAAAEDFAAVARALGSTSDTESLLAGICGLAVERLPGRAHAAVSLTEGRKGILPRGSTDAVPLELDRIQHESGEGPSLDVIRKLREVYAGDLCSDPRWPEFARSATERTGVRSVLSFRLSSEDRTLGVLNLYSDTPLALSSGAAALRWGRVYAVHSSIALAGARAQQELRAALETRETISVAIGLLMAREGVDRQGAFDMLRRASQRTNVKLRDVAARITDDNDQHTRRPAGQATPASARRTAAT